MTEIESAMDFLNACTSKTRREILRWLRARYAVHPLEREFGTSAEVILEAIARSSDLSKRGVRGLIAEAIFKIEIVDREPGLEDVTPEGNHAFDFLLRTGGSQISVQVKMQRLRDGQPMWASEGYRALSSDFFVVETQRTRGGRDPGTGEDTRPYRFGEFDILAVSMQPSTGDWSSFMYTVANWLLPRPDEATKLLKFQPIPKEPDGYWTDSLVTCIKWCRAGEQRQIKGRSD